MTAVEWLMLEKALVGYIDDEMVEQALEMEKQQIIKAVEWNYKSNMGEVYYNAVYKNKEK